VRHYDGEVRVRLTTEELLIITQRQSDQPIEARGVPAGVPSNLLAMLGGLITPWHDFVELNFAVRGANAQPTPTEPLELPLIPPQGAAVGAGEHPFALAWLGGTPPFRVSIVAASDGKAVLNSAEETSRELPLHPLVLAAGPYALRLADAAGQTLERPIEAVPTEEIPRAPLDPALDRLPRTWGATAKAGWLAGQNKGRWLLEAFLEATPMAGAFEPARILVDLLAKGGPAEPR
jgi:hypothetical protein